MTIREHERRAEQRRRSDPAQDRENELSHQRVLTLARWCALNWISPATGRRIIRSGTGPTITRLSGSAHRRNCRRQRRVASIARAQLHPNSLKSTAGRADPPRPLCNRLFPPIKTEIHR